MGYPQNLDRPKLFKDIARVLRNPSIVQSQHEKAYYLERAYILQGYLLDNMVGVPGNLANEGRRFGFEFSPNLSFIEAATQLEQAARHMTPKELKLDRTVFKFEHHYSWSLNFGGVFKVLMELFPILLTSDAEVLV